MPGGIRTRGRRIKMILHLRPACAGKEPGRNSGALPLSYRHPRSTSIRPLVERWGPAEALRFRPRVVAFAPGASGFAPRRPHRPIPVCPPRVPCGAGERESPRPRRAARAGRGRRSRRIGERRLHQGAMHPGPPALLLLRIVLQPSEPGTRPHEWAHLSPRRGRALLPPGARRGAGGPGVAHSGGEAVQHSYGSFRPDPCRGDRWKRKSRAPMSRRASLRGAAPLPSRASDCRTIIGTRLPGRRV